MHALPTVAWQAPYTANPDGLVRAHLATTDAQHAKVVKLLSATEEHVSSTIDIVINFISWGDLIAVHAI